MPQSADNPYSAPSAAAAPAVPAPPRVSYRPGGALATTSFALLLANAGLSVMTLIYWIVMWSRLANRDVDRAWLESLWVQTLLLTVTGVVLFILTAVFFSIWFYRVYRNLLALGHATTERALWWAPAGFFIPVMNLFMPYLVGREIWLGSDPESLRRSLDDFRLVPPSRTAGPVAAWWFTLVSSWILGRVAVSGIESGRVDRLGSLFFLLVLTSALTATAAIFGALVVRGVEQRQRRRHTRLTSATGDSDSGRIEASF